MAYNISPGTGCLYNVEFKEIIEESSGGDFANQHYEAEAETLKHLLNLEKEFRAHYALMTKELQQQEQCCSRLWILAQRYVLLQRLIDCPTLFL